MTQTQNAAREDAAQAFKRHILEQSRGFVSEPMADLFRVNLLALMLNRYDELRAKGVGEIAGQSRVIYEFDDIAAQMREEGFEETDGENAPVSRWPQMSEAEVDAYLREKDAYLHKNALGVAMCSSCVFPLMIGAAFDAMFGGWGGWQAETIFSLLGLVGMFAMIALGVYFIVMAQKPKKENAVKERRFSLSSRVRRKLTELREAVEEKARRRKGKGIALLVGCVAPIFVGAALDSLWGMLSNTPFAIFGVAGMFVMIGAGVYELVLGDGEKKAIARLLNEKP